MKKLLTIFQVVIFSISLFSGIVFSAEKVFTKKDIKKLADVYVNNNPGLKNPVIVDIDKDGDFDILNFNKKGKVEYYKNTGTLEIPFFVLENNNYDNYEINSFLPEGIPIPVFFADNDGDKDLDIFGVTNDGFDTKTKTQKYNVTYAENSFDFDHYTLITIILVLLIVVLLIAIL